MITLMCEWYDILQALGFIILFRQIFANIKHASKVSFFYIVYSHLI